MKLVKILFGISRGKMVIFYSLNYHIELTNLKKTQMSILGIPDKKPSILKVNFVCLLATDIEVEIELIEENRVLGLEQAWEKAIEHYCANNKEKMHKKLRSKLGPSYNFHDLSDVILRFKNCDGYQDAVFANSNYAIFDSD